MKRVNNADVFVKLNPKIININNFTIKFYTVNAESFFIYKTNEDVIPIQREVTIDDVDAIINGETAVTEYYIKLYWSELLTLGEGVLQYLVLNSTKYLDRTTEFYINSNIIVDDESGSTYPEVIAELGAKIDGEIERSTSADTEHQEAINDEIATRQQNVLDLTDLLVNDYYTKTEVDNRIESASTPTDLSNYYTKSEVDTAIANVDVSDQLSGYVETTDFNTYSGDTDTKINSKLDATAYTPTDLSNYYNKSQVYNKTEVDTTIGTVNGKISSISGVVDTKLDSTAYTPTDLSDYYTKTEVDEKITQSGSFDPTQYYNKTDVDGKVSTLSGAIDTKLDATAYTPTDLSNYYQKSQTSGATEISTALASKLDSTAYTPTDLTNYYTKSETSGSTEISNALASKLDSTAYTPTDLTNYYTKSETSGATEISTALGNKQSTLVSGTNIKTINNTSILGSGNITIEGGSGSSGFIQVNNPDTADTKVGLVNSLSEYYSTNIGNHAVIEGDGYIYNETNYNIEASGDYSHAEGNGTKAIGNYSHAEGNGTTASGYNSHAEGSYTKAIGDYSHAEGNGTTASGYNSHAEGNYTTASGYYSHAEGNGTTASDYNSHAEGSYTNAIGSSSHAEGSSTVANGHKSHAEGSSTQAIGDYSHAEGSDTKAIGTQSHAEGGYTIANNWAAHAEGQGTKALGQCSHAEGSSTVAVGDYSHAEGNSTQAIGDYSHAEGNRTIANNQSEHASGQYNVSSSASTTFGDSGNTLFSVGNGTDNNTMHNAFEIRQNGDIYITSGSTDIKLQDHLGGNVDLSNYYTKTEVNEIVDDVIAGQIDLSTYAKIDWVQTNYALKTDVPKIWIGTQSEYDALATKDNNTIYIIKDD